MVYIIIYFFLKMFLSMNDNLDIKIVNFLYDGQNVSRLYDLTIKLIFDRSIHHYYRR
jgi:hypothetical protein